DGVVFGPLDHGSQPAARRRSPEPDPSPQKPRPDSQSRPDGPNSHCRPTAHSDPGATAAAAASRYSAGPAGTPATPGGPRHLDHPGDSPRHDAAESWPEPRTR